VAITGEIDINSALAQLANARYASDSVGSGNPALNRQGNETLAVLTSLAEVRAAVNEVAATAQRLISIYTPDLEPDLYDQSAFLEVIKHFVLTRSFAKVRVLLAEPTRVMRDSNRFVAMGRRLSSCIDIRYVAAQAPQRFQHQAVASSAGYCTTLTVFCEGIEILVLSRSPRTEFDQVWAPAKPNTACAPPVGSAPQNGGAPAV
jgi:hypothetical protein